MKLIRKICAVSLSALMLAASEAGAVSAFAADSLNVTGSPGETGSVGAADKKHVVDMNDYFRYEEKQDGDYIYIEFDDNTVGIVSYLGSGKNIVFPSKIGGKTVSCVGVSGGVIDWDAMENVASVSLPDSVDTIGNYSFNYLPNLEKVDFSDRVSYIGEGAFSGCTKLWSIPVEAASENIGYVGSSAFYGTKWLENQSDGVVYVGSVAYTCKGNVPEHIDIRPGTVTITQLAFAAPDMSSLKSIYIPESVNEIFDNSCGYTFSYQSGFTKTDGFTIYGKKNTAAERYANENNFKFIQSESETVPGDINGDGMLNAADRVYLTRHLAKWESYDKINEKAADLNSDGVVNTKDRIILARHIAKWDGYGVLPVAK